jgi:tRNA modification GTPase
MYVGDTIAAVATPSGAGGIGVVRVSGPRSTEIATAVFSAARAAPLWESRRLQHGRIVANDGSTVDEALAVLMREPHSYTGEDVLELHCHGSRVVLRRVLSLVLAHGARLATPGEFTKRAFLNGRLDLAQAEAVADLVRARTETGAAMAAQQLCGRLSAELARVRDNLIRVKALLEADIDFSDEDFSIDPAETDRLAASCEEALTRLIDSYRHGKIVRDGIRVSIVGKPNVGKSSLLNALLGEDRAIVTPLPGTTRDSIDESVDFDGAPVLLSDTAGLRGESRADVVEQLGMQRTAAKLAAAECAVVVLDASRRLDADDHVVLEATKGVLRVIALNKIDLPASLSTEEANGAADGSPVLPISATEHLGLAELRHAVVTQAEDGRPLDSGVVVVTNLRHRDALEKGRGSLRLARGSIAEGRPADVVAVDVQDAVDRLGEITGTVTTEDVLDRVFSEFCVGK